MKINRVEMQGAKELDAALKELGVEVAAKIGVAAVRAGSKALQAELVDSAPYNPAGPTSKVYTAKSGQVRRTDYGHLRDNLRVRRMKSVKPYTVPFIVTIGRAFWGFFLEHGTVRMAARPWARPTFDRMQTGMMNAIVETLRKGTERAARRLARQRKRAGIGHNGGPAIKG